MLLNVKKKEPDHAAQQQGPLVVDSPTPQRVRHRAGMRIDPTGNKNTGETKVPNTRKSMGNHNSQWPKANGLIHEARDPRPHTQGYRAQMWDSWLLTLPDVQIPETLLSALS